jgi:hypothetical protein
MSLVELTPGFEMQLTDILFSPNLNHRLYFSSDKLNLDTNVVTTVTNADRLRMMDSGNLAIINTDGNQVWSVPDDSKILVPGSIANITNDGKIQIVSGAGNVVWSFP